MSTSCHVPAARPSSPRRAHGKGARSGARPVPNSTPQLHIALVGRPNVGKSTIFNTLTGLTQHTGNWPGKTVELAEGEVVAGGQIIRLVDLPGTYTIGARTQGGRQVGIDEAVARDYVLEHRPDLLVAVVSALSLEQDLYLVGQLLSLPAPVLVALNMIDVARQNGIEVDHSLLAKRLGAPVVPLAATNPDDVHRLRGEMLGFIKESKAVEEGAGAAAGRASTGPCAKCPFAVGPAPGGAASCGGTGGGTAGQGACPGGLFVPRPDVTDPAAIYGWVDLVLEGVRQSAGRRHLDRQVDRFLTHPELGMLFLMTILGLAFAITFGVGVPLQKLLATWLVAPIGQALRAATASLPPWVGSLLVDGVLGGAGIVVTFLPVMGIFFAMMAILEDIGYMARAAVVMDRFMHRLGLHGKSFLPLFLGFGCNVPAVMGTRTIESKRGRILTTLLTPLVPCSARLTVLNFMAASFFGVWAAVVVWASIGLNVLMVAVLGVVLSRTILRDPEGGELVMELPAYHRPSPRVIGYLLWFKLKSFLNRAGTVIVVASVILWALAYFPGGSLEHSFLAQVGRLLEPVGRLAGLDWRLLVATLASFVAKENALAALAVVFGVGNGVANGAGATLVEAIRHGVAPASALSFLTLVMLFIPCLATVTVMYQELKSKAWTAFGVLMLLIVSFAMAAGVYRVALLFS